MTAVSTDPTSPSLINTLGKTGSATSADFNMFLKLLTTQMQNQDPLKPMDSSEYTQQLVQFSQVEQSVQQTSTLKNILAQLTGGGMADAASFIGKEARFDSATSGLGSSPAAWGWTAPNDVASLKAVVTDASGKVVSNATIAATGASGKFNWDGTTSSGGQAPAGSYTLALTGTDSAGNIVPVSVQSIGIVKSVMTGDSGVMLGVNGADLPLSSLVGVTTAS
ncbi:MAG: flagellar hook capping protein [Alphaproteobacteria bacterium]|nr:flagellar hook capping protein [Alphaproteobacteria bacterium]MDB5721032.1 flagellar hook capping protein [Alphaproteobacteria bacterium]